MILKSLGNTGTITTFNGLGHSNIDLTRSSGTGNIQGYYPNSSSYTLTTANALNAL